MRVPRAGPCRVLLAGAACIAIASAPLRALEDVPQAPGWHGRFVIGPGVQRIESHFVAGSRLGEVGQDRIDSLFDAPERVTDFVSVVDGEIGYRFAGSPTYLIAGNSIEDPVRYDFTSRLGVRQGLAGGGIVEAHLLFSAIPARAWEDPYVTGRAREATDRNSRGVRLAWDRIGGTGIEVDLIARWIDHENDRSGAFPALPAAQRRLLARDGWLRQVRAAWRIPVAPRHHLIPGMTFQDNDRDGGAVTSRGGGSEIGYNWFGAVAQVFATLRAEATRFEEDHPLYGRRADARGAGLTIIALFPGWLPGAWSGGLVGAFHDEDSDIAFFDARITSFALIGSRRW